MSMTCRHVSSSLCKKHGVEAHVSTDWFGVTVGPNDGVVILEGVADLFSHYHRLFTGTHIEHTEIPIELILHAFEKVHG